MNKGFQFWPVARLKNANGNGIPNFCILEDWNASSPIVHSVSEPLRRVVERIRKVIDGVLSKQQRIKAYFENTDDAHAGYRVSVTMDSMGLSSSKVMVPDQGFRVSSAKYQRCELTLYTRRRTLNIADASSVILRFQTGYNIQPSCRFNWCIGRLW